MIEILKWAGTTLLGVLVLGISVMVGLIIKHIHDNIMK
jgi:hypothetical protein